MSERLAFTLTGRDELSRVMNGTGDSADRLRLRLSGIAADADGQLRDLRGRFLSADDAARRLGDSTHGTRDSLGLLRDEAGKLGESLKANLISLLPAAIPMAAGLAGTAGALAGQLGAVALSAAAFGLALKPQIGAIGEAIAAQEAYDNAVESSGATSQEAAKAQADYMRTLKGLPPATREAAVAVGLLKENFADWSDDLAGDVMAPVNKGIAVTNALLPRTTGLVQGASTQLDRLITMAGGAVETPGFDRMTDRVTTFANRTLQDAVDGLTVFLAKAQAGELDDSGLARFMDYCRENGPAVWETLGNVGEALVNVLDAGSDVGVGMLDVVNALSGIVSAVPPEGIALVLQLAIAIRAVKLAAVGVGTAKAALLALGTQVMALRTAAAGAPGVIGGVTAAIGGLSRGAKLAIAGTGLGLLLVALTELSQRGKSTPPDVDKLTDSLKQLGATGRVTGEAARVMGKDMGDLATTLDRAAGNANSGMDKFNDLMNTIFTLGQADSNYQGKAKEEIDGIDKSLANLVKGGQADLAAAALDNMVKKLGLSGDAASEFRGQMGDYKEALAGAALEQQLAADSMGLFGAQAQAVQQKLDEQKRSTDGLRQSIQALNDVNRQGLSGMIGFEAAVDAAAEAAKKNAGVLRMQGGELVLTTEKQRAAATALNDLASKTDEAAASARESGASWSEVNGIYERGRQQLIANAQQMGLNESQAKRLADQILKTPDKTARLKGNLEDLEAKLADAKHKLKSVPDSRRAKVLAEISDLQRKIDLAKLELGSLHNKTVYIQAHMYITGSAAARAAVSKTGSGRIFEHAAGGRVRGYAGGGDVQFFPEGGYISGPGTSTSDSVLALFGSGAVARVSDTEFVVRSSSVNKYGVPFLNALNQGVLNPALVKAAGYAAGGLAGGGFTYSPTASSAARISTSTVSSWYDQDMQRLKDAWAQLNEAMRAQAKKSTAATRKAVADAQKAVNAADRALGLKAGTKASGFSLTGYSTNLKEAVQKSAAWERDLQKIGKRAGSDVEQTLRDMGEAGQALVASLAKASTKQFNEVVSNLRKLAPTAKATLADYTRQLTATTSSSKKFQDDLLKLSAAGYGDLAMQLAGQGDADAMAIAVAAVKSPSAAKKANAAVKANEKLLSSDELTAASQLLGALSGKKNATVADVVAAGVSWPMIAHLAPLYAKQIKAIPGSATFVKDMKERGIALAGGGLLRGPGTSTSDSIPLWGSAGEYMVKAAAVAKYGVKFMDDLNSGQLPVGRAGARPGLPAAPAAAASTAGSDRPPVTYNLYPRKSVIDVEDLQLLQRQEEARQRVGRPR
ncbi:hypothetical protein [Streptomyces sp. CoT10]|uniref:hypothetical protein n=1 Tax=Streptomyces sp. CoT10 TaxID=2875762 RepID=UPI001CD2B07E|nr:hypothetical protein [Streptomyces sp. CoT10]